MIWEAALIGLILLLDGIVSVAYPGAHGWLFDGGRVIRSFIGVVLICMAFLGLGVGAWGGTLLIGMGVWIVLDGMGSIIIESGQVHGIRDSGRVFRALLGVVMVLMGMGIIK
jgi:hypothetical protein